MAEVVQSSPETMLPYLIPDPSGGVMVQRALPGSDASKKGLSAGDKIVRVNGVEVSSLVFPQVNQMIQQSGTKIRLGLQRTPASGRGVRDFDVTLKAKKFNYPRMVSLYSQKNKAFVMLEVPFFEGGEDAFRASPFYRPAKKLLGRLEPLAVGCPN